MAAQQNYIVTGMNYIITIGQSILQIFWLLVTHDYIGYLLIQSIGTFIYNFSVSYIAKRRFPYIVGNKAKSLEKEEKRGLIKNVRALIVWKLSGLMVNSTDNIIITYFNGLTTVGLSSNYTLLSTTLNSLLNQLFNGITASVGNLNAIETKEKKMSMFYSINLANFWLFGWAAIGIFVVSTDIVQLFFGSDYILPLSIPFVIALNFYMVGMQSAVWTFKNTLGLFRPGRYLLIVTAVLNLIFSIWLGELWGLFGILFATAISRALTNTWYDPYAVFKYGFNESASSYFIAYIKYAAILLVTGFICFEMSSFIHFSVGINVFFKICICSIIPNLIFLVCFGRTREFIYFKELFEKIIKKLFHK